MLQSRETRERVSRKFNWIEISTRMLRTSEEHSIYTKFGCYRPIETIDIYDGTVHRGPFCLSRGSPIPMNGLDDPAQLIVIKRLGCRPWIAIGRLRCDPRRSISVVITLLKYHVRFDWLVVHGAFDRRASFRAPPDPMLRMRPRHLHS